jgi:hypothetical protein
MNHANSPAEETGGYATQGGFYGLTAFSMFEGLLAAQVVKHISTISPCVLHESIIRLRERRRSA